MEENELRPIESALDAAPTAGDNTPWYAVRLYTMRIYEVDDYFRQQGFSTFIPQQYDVWVDREGKRRRELKPVVRNLLFVKDSTSLQALKEAVLTDRYKMALVKSSRLATGPAPISAHEMREFIMMCNPEITMKLYVSEEEARLKAGDMVTVHHGPLKGLTGRLVRKSKKYYLLKEMPGIGVMLKVSKWCCTPLLP